jgi:hypothetical protein
MRQKLMERYAQIETEARVLAWSGHYEGAEAIEMALLAKGYKEAVELFANRWTKSELDRLCDEARRRRDTMIAA